MTKNLVIRNLGPIKNFEFPIKKVNIFIGPQASGKSTIAKAYFLVKNVKNEIYKYIVNIKTEEDVKHLLGRLNKILRRRFIEIFGKTKDKTKNSNIEKFEIIYMLTNSKYIRFYLDNENWVKVEYSNRLKKEIEDLKKYLYQLTNIYNELKNDPLNEEKQISKTRILSILLERLNIIFEDYSSLTYIPAGRTLITLLGEHINTVSIAKLDYITSSYINKMLNLKQLFQSDLETILKTYEKLETKKIDYRKVNLAIRIIKKILKGKYLVENGEERIYFDKDKYIKINYASSGQQEALWILNFIYYEILYRKNSTLIVEEPEAHLFPDAQKDIVDLLALFVNSQRENELIITTHSPYILTSFNNLIYAYNVNKKLKNKKKKEEFFKIKEDFFIDFKDVNAFYIKDGEAYSILDEETQQIKAEEIDRISEKLNEELDRLITLEVLEEN